MNNKILHIVSLVVLQFLVVVLCVNAQSNSQETEINTITIEQCYEWSRANYPLVEELGIIDKTTAYNISNASKGNLPQVNINGQASYQSDVTSINIDLPGFEVPKVDKDQYKMYAEIYQPLTNFSNVKAQKDIVENSGSIDKQKVELDFYKLKDRVNQIYFGALLIDEKIEQLKITQAYIDSTLLKVEAAIKNGMAIDMDKQLLTVERITLEQKIDESKLNLSAFVSMLKALTGKNISENTELIKPVVLEIPATINRPELELFHLQNQSMSLKQKQLKSSVLPKLGLFAQGGYGKPALNMLSSDFDAFYIGGVKLNWALSSLYTFRNTKKTLSLAQDRLMAQQNTFLLNTALTQTQQSSEITKFERLLISDNEIIEIREQVLETAKVQLTNGVITTLDFIKYLNDLNQAQQAKILHETQLLLAQHNLKITTGN